MLTEQDVVQRVVNLTEVRLRTWVARGWLSPAHAEGRHVFTELDVARCNMIRQFRDDLEIDDETVPVVLSLLDQVYGLRRELRNVMRAIGSQPEDVRRQMLKAIKNQRED
jgi:chaperone modulatory protein CbpM